MQDFYILNRAEYWKYYYLSQYYQFADLPLVVQVCAVFTTICILLFLILVIRTIVNGLSLNYRERKIEECRALLTEPLRAIILEPEQLEAGIIADRLGIPKNYKLREKTVEAQLPVLRELYHENHGQLNRGNWHRTLQVLKVPGYFDQQIRSHRMRRRITALKVIADIDAPLKEAVASRYLFAKDAKLKMAARLHAAQFGTSYPFKVLEEDPKLVFTAEKMVKYHHVLAYRKENGLPMPNLIRWCRRTPVNEELRVFAVNEMRLFKDRDACPQLLEMLRDSQDERFSCALIRALGEMEYIPAETEFRRRYSSASFLERQALAEALGTINSGSPEVVSFLTYDFKRATDSVSRMKLLRVLRSYGSAGREAYEKLKSEATRSTAALFEHIECDLIDSRRYA